MDFGFGKGLRCCSPKGQKNNDLTGGPNPGQEYPARMPHVRGAIASGRQGNAGKRHGAQRIIRTPGIRAISYGSSH